MNEPAGTTKSPLANVSDALQPAHEPEIEHPRTAGAPFAPSPIATPLRELMTPLSSSPIPFSSGRNERAPTSAAPSLQATVETAPPSPCIEPVKIEQDDPAVVALENGREDGRGNHEERLEYREQEGTGNVRESSILYYVPPSPGQVERGEPLTGWLWEPPWLRRKVTEFAQRNMRGDQ